MSEIVIPKKLDKKYAILWHDISSHKTPLVLRAGVREYKPTNRREQEVYNWALWELIDMMADDGLIKQETIRDIHNKENGWINRSKITVGKVPIYFWLVTGFFLGSVFSLIVALVTALIKWMF